jgi:hypothetical protein
MNLKYLLHAVLVAFFLGFGGNALAGLVTIDFEGEATGSKPNGYTVAGAPGVHFSDTVGAGLFVANYGAQGQGQSLGVNSDSDGGGLRIDLDFVADFISLDFGNDDPGWSVASDIAYLELFLNDVSMGATSVLFNRDDIMNQTISMAGIEFDSAFFVYTDPDLGGFTNVGNSPLGLIEIVDNIQINQIPEPTTLALMGLGLAGVGFTRKKKQA